MTTLAVPQPRPPTALDAPAPAAAWPRSAVVGALTRLPVDVLEMDRELVTDIARSP